MSIRSAFNRLIEARTPDILHSHFVQTTLGARLLLGNSRILPRVFQVAGPLHLESMAFRLLDTRSAGALDYWVAACALSRTLLMGAGVHESRIALAYHGIDPADFPPRICGGLRRELGLDSSVPIVGMVAYMYPPKRHLGQNRGLKGHEDLIDAVARLGGELENAVCVFVGGAWGENAASYEAKVRAYGERVLGRRAIFLGTRDDVLDLYTDFDVAVHPSHSENLGGAVESMMMARPTIASSVGGFPDIVIHGKTGWMVPPKSPDALAEAIASVLRDKHNAQRVAEDGRRYVSRKLDIRAETAKLIEYYDAIVGAHRRHAA